MLYLHAVSHAKAKGHDTVNDEGDGDKGDGDKGGDELMTLMTTSSQVYLCR